MKLKAIFIFIALCITSSIGYSKQDPAMSVLTVSPNSNLKAGDAITINAQIGNAADETSISGIGFSNRMAFTITMNEGITNVVIDTGQPIYNIFDITYDPVTNTIEAIQKDNVAIPANTFYNLTITAVAGSQNITAIGNVIPNPTSIRDLQTESNDDIITEAALPVVLTHFSATKEGNNVALQWQTTEEVNSDRFEVMRSDDSKNWATIATVNAQRNSTSLQSYHHLDVTPVNGTSYYRLKMVDLDGTFEMSNLISLQFEGLQGIVLAPNPVVNTLRITGTTDAEVAKVELRNTTGQLLHQSFTVREIDMQQLPTGMYIVAITKKDGSVTAHKVIKR